MTIKTYVKLPLSILLFCSFVHSLCAQQHERDSLVQKFLLNIEIRPRTEYRYNYILPPKDTLSPDVYITQRNRASMQYARKKWLIKSDVQEIHVWKQGDNVSQVGSVAIYQLYAESLFRSVNVRIGRQRVLFDNGRLFSDAPWAQQGRSHEGIRLMKETKRISTDLLFLFTRKYEKYFDATYSPVAANRYKYLFIYQFSYRSQKLFSFNTINAVDLFEDAASGRLYTRATIGGRAELKNERWYVTLNAFIQCGEYPSGKKVLAYYLQPEIRLTRKTSVWRLGAEVISGTGAEQSGNQSGNFDVLYGVLWKFNGNMNVFTRFPSDVGGRGLINPYFFVTVPVGRKLAFRSDFHLFFTQYALLNESGQQVSKYLGFEHDLSLKYIPVKNVEINGGFSFFISSASMQYLPKILDVTQTAVWSYVMVSYTLNAIHATQYKKQ